MLETGSVVDFSVFDFFFLMFAHGQVHVVKLKTQILTKFQI